MKGENPKIKRKTDRRNSARSMFVLKIVFSGFHDILNILFGHSNLVKFLNGPFRSFLSLKL